MFLIFFTKSNPYDIKFAETFKFRKCWWVLGIDTFLVSIRILSFFVCETELNKNETKDSEATGIDYPIHA